MNNSLITLLKQMRGNTRTIVFTEPLWGIPYNLYAPYMSVYMLALGMHDSQIGLVTSISLVFQMVWALLSGAITDKLGRKRATYLSDMIAWVIPSLLFAASQGFIYFLIGTIIQSAWRVAHTSWSCLIAESVPQEELVNIYTWIYIAGLLSAFVAPITGLLVARFDVVITMRGVFVFACLMMTAKFIIFNQYVKETPRGIERMQESKNQPLLSMLSEYRGVFRLILRSPTTLYTLGILLATGVCYTIQNTFWAILVTEKLHIPASMIAYYPFARSIIMLVFFFFVLPFFTRHHFKNSMLLGLSGFFISQVLLICMPPWTTLAAAGHCPAGCLQCSHFQPDDGFADRHGSRTQ
jgi:DHA1 family tetracycline resistance protein-like MFS transporter